jgi:hypothetical protein
MNAVGIHDHPGLKLGLQPPDHSREALLLEDYLTGVVPAHPTNIDYLAGVEFGLYGNDRWGVCGPVSVANSRREVTVRLTGRMAAPSQNDVFDLYRRSGNPNFNPSTRADDNGVNMQTMLQALVAGGIGGVKPLGFAKVTGSIDVLKAAVSIFGFLLMGVDLQTAQQNQTNQGVWDYAPSPAWGGHAILGGKYGNSPEGISVITWAQLVRMTDAFMANQLSEAWVVLWPEHLGDHQFLSGVDVAALAQDYQDLTGRPFPAQIPPRPTPTPAPVGPGLVTIDVAAKKIIYPSGWTATQEPAKSDFHLI